MNFNDFEEHLIRIYDGVAAMSKELDASVKSNIVVEGGFILVVIMLRNIRKPIPFTTSKAWNICKQLSKRYFRADISAFAVM